MAAVRNMASTDKPFEMQTPDQWKAFSHPLRLRILELLAAEARTNEELAAALGEQSGKLYFHTKKLLDARLIVLDSTRQKGPITEKLYRAVARRFTAPTPVKGGVLPPLERAVAAGLDLYRASWEATGGLLGQSEIGFHLVLPIGPERRADFAARVRALFDDFQAEEPEAPGAEKIALTVLMHSVDKNTDKKETKDADAKGTAVDGTVSADGSGACRAE